MELRTYVCVNCGYLPICLQVAAIRFAEIGKETDYANIKLIKSAFEKDISKYMLDTLKCIGKTVAELSGDLDRQ